MQRQFQSTPMIAGQKPAAVLRSAIAVAFSLAISANVLSLAKTAVAQAPAKDVSVITPASAIVKPLSTGPDVMPGDIASGAYTSGISLTREALDLSLLPASAFGDTHY